LYVKRFSVAILLHRFLIGNAILVALCGFTEIFCALVLHWH